MGGREVFFACRELCVCAPSPPLGGEGRGEGAPPRVVSGVFALLSLSAPHPDPLSRSRKYPTSAHQWCRNRVNPISDASAGRGSASAVQACRVHRLAVLTN